jgi:tetratricopeptide (TPR) repeat protein
MTEMFHEAVEAAQRAVVSAAPDLQDLNSLIDRLDLALPGAEDERAHLAVLLDWLGLYDQAAGVLQQVNEENPREGRAGNARLRNVEGMLAARHGRHSRAIELFNEALTAAQEGTPLRTKILANLAAASLQAGQVTLAGDWLAKASEARMESGDQAVDVLLASVRAAGAAIEGNPGHLRAAVSELEEASRSRIARLGANHPQALMAVANMATAEFELASVEDSFEGQGRAIRVLEVASRRLSAELGADHPQALAAMANLCMADLVLARADSRAQRLESAVVALEAVSSRLDSVLGADHIRALLVRANVTSAKIEKEQALVDSTHYETSMRVRKAGLGMLTLLAEGESNRVFRADEFHQPGDSTALAYKEFTAGHARQVRSAGVAVAFRAGLSPAERDELDQYYIWPRALVEDASGTICGFLMPFIPEDYFCRLADPNSNQPISRPRELSWLIASARQRTAAQVDVPEVDQTERLILLAQLVYAIGRLHKLGWIFGDLNSKNVVFALDPPGIMLVDCGGAAPISDLDPTQHSTPFWDPPENPIGDPVSRQAPQDTATDVYKLGLAILRCLTPGKGASTARSVDRVTDELDAEGIDLLDRALSADRGRRPTVKEMYRYLFGLVSQRTALPEVLSARLATPHRLRGQDVRIEWQIEKASSITILVGNSLRLPVDAVAYPDGYLFRPDESGAVSIEAKNRFGAVIVDLGEVVLEELPPFTLSLDHLPRPQIPSMETFSPDPIISALAGAPHIGSRFSETPSLRILDLIENHTPDIPRLVMSTIRY